MKKLALALTLACLLGPASTRAQNAYITNLGPYTVSVIDTATDTVIATILPVGLVPFGVAVGPDRSNVYVTNNGSPTGTVSATDTATNTVRATLPLRRLPHAGAGSPARRNLTVSHPR